MLKKTCHYWRQHFCILADRSINEGNDQNQGAFCEMATPKILKYAIFLRQEI